MDDSGVEHVSPAADRATARSGRTRSARPRRAVPLAGLVAAALGLAACGCGTSGLNTGGTASTNVAPAKALGPVLAIGIAVGMLAMLTLLPALLVIFPRGVFWPHKPTCGSPEPTPTTRGVWARIGWAIAPRPRPAWVTTAVILASAR